MEPAFAQQRPDVQCQCRPRQRQHRFIIAHSCGKSSRLRDHQLAQHQLRPHRQTDQCVAVDPYRSAQALRQHGLKAAVPTPGIDRDANEGDPGENCEQNDQQREQPAAGPKQQPY